MKVFLTGGTGFIGRKLTQALLRRGWDVHALVRRPESDEARAIRADGARLAQGDVTDRESLRAPMQGAELVVHNAGWYTVGLSAADAPTMHAINVDGTANTLGLAVELGARKIVYTSSVAIYGGTAGVVADESFVRASPPTSVYEQTKTAAHQIAERYQQQGAPLVIGCPGYVIGPGDHSPWGHFARLYVRGMLPPIIWGRDYRHSHVYVDDVAEALALAAERGRPGETYILTAEPLAMHEIMAIWARTPGGFRPLLYMPPSMALAVGALGERVLRALRRPPFLSRETIATSLIDFAFTGVKARRELGARFRGMEELWLQTLAAERTAVSR